MNNPERITVILVTVPSSAVAETIADALLSEKFAACVNILPGLTSRYRWNGAIESANELLLIIKSRASLFEQLRKRILELHPYEVPEIVELAAATVHDAYASWVIAETKSN